jgi:hypothetical protein
MLVSYHAATGRGGDTPTGWLRGAGGNRRSTPPAVWAGMGSGGDDVEHDRRTFVHVHFRVLGRVYP